MKKWGSHSQAEGGEAQRRSERGDLQLATQGPTLPRTGALEETVGPHCSAPSDRRRPDQGGHDNKANSVCRVSPRSPERQEDTQGCFPPLLPPSVRSQTQNRPSMPKLLRFKQLETSRISRPPSWQRAGDSRNMPTLVSSPQTLISQGARSESLHQMKAVSEQRRSFTGPGTSWATRP